MAQSGVHDNVQGRKYKVLKLVCDYCGEERLVIVACAHCGEPMAYKDTQVMEYHEIKDLVEKGAEIEGLNKFPEFETEEFGGSSDISSSSPLTPDDIDALFDSEDWGL